jgi:hypothetical protein
MGFKKDWDTNAIKHWLWSMTYECSSPRNDGFTAFEVKKELLEIKFLLDDLLEDCPKFVGEEEVYHERLLKKLEK